MNIINKVKEIFSRKEQPTLEDAQEKLATIRKKLKAIPKLSKDLRRTPLQQSLIKMGYRKLNWN